jgi:hypothetical protein
MKIKKEAVILAVVIIGLSFYLVLHQRDGTHYTLPTIEEVPEADVSKIEVSKPDGTITLNKKGDQWILSPEGYPAEKGKVKSMLDVISGLTLTAMVSESKSYERYDLNEGKKITVKAWAGETLERTFEIGKAAPSHSHTFVKIAGDHRVYHARSNFKGRFDQTLDNLRDRSALTFESAEIQGVQMKEGETSLSLVRQNVPVEVSAVEEGESAAPKEAWVVEGQEEERQVNESKLDRLLATLSNLKCSAYVDGKNKGDFSKPLYSVDLKGTQTYRLDIFEKMSTEDKRYPAVSSQNDFPFFLSDYLAGQIMVPLEDLVMKREGSEATEGK